MVSGRARAPARECLRTFLQAAEGVKRKRESINGVSRAYGNSYCQPHSDGQCMLGAKRVFKNCALSSDKPVSLVWCKTCVSWLGLKTE